MKQTLQLELLPLLHPPTIAGALASPIGRIAAGFPLEAVEDREHNQLLDLLTDPTRYALCVGDDSMIAAGVFNVDIVIIKSQQR
jgi:SOS-response transcriptional repressor LexA